MQENENMESGAIESTGGGRDKPSKDKKDVWDIIGALGRLAGSLVATAATIVVWHFGNQISVRTEVWENEMELARQRTREIELFSNRESAANQTRSAVFAAFGEYMLPQLEGDDQKVALLAALHSNFSEVFDTRPVFEAFTRSIPIENHDARHELRRLAKRVARRQAEFIASHGGTKAEMTLRWVADEDPEPTHINLAGHDIYVTIMSRPNVISDRRTSYLADGTQVIDDVADVVEIIVRNLQVPEESEEAPPAFELSYMDAPYIDNIWFQHEPGEIHRLAFVLKYIDKVEDDYEVTVEAIHFSDDFLLPLELVREKDIASRPPSNAEQAR